MTVRPTKVVRAYVNCPPNKFGKGWYVDSPYEYDGKYEYDQPYAVRTRSVLGAFSRRVLYEEYVVVQRRTRASRTVRQRLARSLEKDYGHDLVIIGSFPSEEECVLSAAACGFDLIEVRT